MEASLIYCIDASSLIYGHNNGYRHDVFIGLWRRMTELAESGRLRAPEEIYIEVKDWGDALSTWAKLHKSIFLGATSVEQDLLTEMAVRFPPLSDPKRQLVCASAADQMVVALAAARGYAVVSEETKGSDARPKIPQLCAEFGVEQMSFLDLILREGWTFP